MTALSCCRWCGTICDRPPTGRPPVWCAPACMHRYVETFGTRLPYGGDVRFVETCLTCESSTSFDMVGPVIAPGAWLEAATVGAGAVHGHPVSVTVVPVPFAQGVADYTGPALAQQEAADG